MKRLLVVLIISTLACKKGSSPGPKETPGPAKAVLVAPAADASCNDGQVVSATVSRVSFRWNAAENAESYVVNVKNLLTNTSTTHETSATQLSVNLNRSTPYSWYVVSKSSKVSATAESSVWKFYNAGEGTVFYSPYPAFNLIPAMGQSVGSVTGKITLSWTGEDVDNDIQSYDVYLGSSSSNLTKIKEGITVTTVSDVAVTQGTKYYWKVLTKDAQGNTSSSELHNFTVN